MSRKNEVESPSAYLRLRDAILDGTFHSGEKLVEASVAEWCGVSRTPVREALTRLQQDGLVERTDRGIIVRERTPEEIIDLYTVREVLESSAARIAAERYSELDRMRLDKAQRACEAVDAGDTVALARVNREFHECIWRVARNTPLLDLLSRLSLHLGRYPETTLGYPGRWQEALLEHRAIVDAVTSRDADEAERLARQHFTKARAIRLALFEESL